MAEQRTPDDVRRDIAQEREELVLATTQLRRELPKVVAGALAAITALKLLRRRKRA
jgi:hypothetical protein